MKTEITTFGDLKPGDKIIGADGNPVTVSNVYEKHKPKKMYEIEMEDGEIVRSSGNHMWYCETSADEKFKETYKILARDFFEKYDIPEKLEEDELFPTQDLIKIFGEEVSTMMFIEKACKSLGYSSYSPYFIFDNKINTDNIASRTVIMNHSYNDFVDFLHSLKSAINGEGYFFFGEVRTTDEIFRLINKGEYVNIPHKSDLI